ncbi:hypothetical protein [Priestia taiwanensis]|uniref:Uncharacterized protein n=1 Tax=Priestia taiwanensis TaxID=1347902 RepID=A0A917ENK1_9BACI|nr:hypothetical protein [Priestia taiwanensis]MBM7362748.1 hypothetical protein [Priestia taiwanensis]GGE64758.1 hypothetical protein GCM10007140_13720 [Priestia taiwanensis]
MNFNERLIIAVISVALAIVGTLFTQYLLRRFDRKKEMKKNIKAFKGTLGNLIRKIEFLIKVINTIQPINGEKERVIRNFKKQFVAFEIYLDSINRLNEYEENFVSTKYEGQIQKANDILMQIYLYMHQIGESVEDENADRCNLVDKHNLYLFDEVTALCEELTRIKNELPY